MSGFAQACWSPSPDGYGDADESHHAPFGTIKIFFSERGRGFTRQERRSYAAHMAEQRLVYKIAEGELRVAACRYHYER